ncbi:MAG: murein biosynthesis integral membrane protein MurJ [Myxococcales bacterium]|nr:murein biosynthesis integral membrane protein MurJ [Myxococcales bacterium]
MENSEESAIKEAPKEGLGGLVRASSTVGFFTSLSRVAGLTRDMVFMHLFGATHITDAFLMAFTIPNSFRMLVAEGTLTVAFLPVFTEVREGRGMAAAKRLLAQAFGIFPILVALLTGLCILFAEPLVELFASGFHSVPGKFGLTLSLTRTMFPYLFLISLVALCMGALNAMSYFAIPAAAPLLFNLIYIVAMLTLGLNLVDPPMFGVALGVLLAGLGQVLLQVFGLHKAGLLLRPEFNLSPEVRRILWLMAPAILSLAIYQINILVLRKFASYLGEGAVSYLYNADRFLQLPLGIFAIAIATASLPRLARAHAQSDALTLRKAFVESLDLTNCITIPAAIALYMLAYPIVCTIFQHGSFTAEMAENTAAALEGFSLGLVAIAGIRVSAQAFFAIKDTVTPMLCSGVGLAANLAFAPYLGLHYGFVGLALSVSLAAWLQLFIELILVRLRLGPLGLSEALFNVLRVVLASALMGAALHFLATYGAWEEGLAFANVALLVFTVLIGLAVYLLTCLLFGHKTLGVLVRISRKKLLKQSS